MAGENWPLVPLGELTENLDGRRVPVKENERKPGPYPYYGASGIVDRVGGYLFDGEYLLIGEDGENLRTRQTPIAFMATGKFWVNNHAHIVRGNHRAHTRFLCYVLSQTEISGYLTGSTMPKLTQGNLNRLPVIAPPLAEQKAIAAVLGALDDKIELNRRMNATLEAMARALFQSWFVDFDPVRAKLDSRQPVGRDAATAALFPASFDHQPEGAVPKDWERRRWGDIATLEYGKSIRDYRESSGKYRVFGTNGPIGYHDEALCDGPGIVIGRKGAYRGVHFSSQPFFAIDTAFYLKPKGTLDLKWAYYELLRFDINNMDSGSAIPSTSRDDFYGIPVIVPSPKVQDAFGQIVDKWFATIFANDKQSGTLATLRDTLLPKLLSGELSVARVKHQVLEKTWT